jgi:outer membrane protein assembly factor BamB
LAWQTTLPVANTADAGSISQPAVAGGRVFVMSGNTIVAFDTANGAQLWRSTDGPVIRNTARLVAVGSRVFAANLDAAAFDVATGRELWRQRLDSAGFYTADAADDLAYYVGDVGHVYAFGVADGRLRWKNSVGSNWPLSGRIFGIATSGDTVYAVGRKYGSPPGPGSTAVIIALDRRDGTLLWKWEASPWAGQYATSDASWSPEIAGSLLVMGSIYGRGVFALDRFSRQEAWRATPFADGVAGGVVRVGDVVYAGSIDGTTAAFDLATGQLRWRSRPLPGSLFGVQACADRLFATDYGVEVLDRQTGEVLASWLHDGSAVVSGIAVSGDVIYVKGATTVYAIRCRG